MGALFSYPMLRAADILIHTARRTAVSPWGVISGSMSRSPRDLAESFNRVYGAGPRGAGARGRRAGDDYSWPRRAGR